MADVRPEVAAFLGGAVLIGGIAIGKTAVDAAGSKWQPAEQTGHRRDLDDAVRLVATIVGIGVTLLQLPQAWQQAQELIARLE